VIAPERLLEDPPAEAALAWLRRSGFAEPERSARELRSIAADPEAGDAFRSQIGPLLDTFADLPDPDSALVHLERFVRAGGAGVLSALRHRGPRAADALLWAVGGTPFLAEQVIRHPEWADWLTRPGVLSRPRRARQVALDARKATRGHEAARDALRLARRREVLAVAVRDLLRLSPVEETLGALSSVADALVEVALDVAASETRARAGAGGLAVLALGKLGGGELNFSSDVDLVYVHRGGRGSPEAHARASALARHLTAVLGETLHEGHVYRVDLRLRPEGRAGALTHSLEAAEEYYRRRGATWERLALLKARLVAGDAAVGREFGKRVAPFVWDRPFDAEAVRQVLRLKQETDRRLATRGLAGRHVKLGRGGIREIELVVQVLQVRHGGPLRLPRCRGTLLALDALRSASVLATPEHDALSRAYRFLRDVENKLQMVHDTQTHVVPEDPEELARLAARLGYRRGRDADPAGRLRHDLAEQTGAVHQLYESLLGRLVRTGSAP